MIESQKAEGNGAITQEAYSDSDVEVLKDMAPVNRPPWQLLMTSVGEEPINVAISPETSRALVRILDLRSDLGAVTLRTENGEVRVGRDFPSDKSERIDELIARIFRSDHRISAISFPEHTATADDPYPSPLGKPSAAIRAAVSAGEITPDEATGRLTALHIVGRTMARKAIEQWRDVLQVRRAGHVDRVSRQLCAAEPIHMASAPILTPTIS